jgi:hypothetical protein
VILICSAPARAPDFVLLLILLPDLARAGPALDADPDYFFISTDEPGANTTITGRIFEFLRF